MVLDPFDKPWMLLLENRARCQGILHIASPRFRLLTLYAGALSLPVETTAGTSTLQFSSLPRQISERPLNAMRERAVCLVARLEIALGDSGLFQTLENM